MFRRRRKLSTSTSKVITVPILILGAGPTGLALSKSLNKRNVEHIILERSHKVASSWGNVPDTFRLAMTVKDLELPEYDMSGYAPTEHLDKAQIQSLFEEYAHDLKSFITFNAEVTSITRLKDVDKAFVITTKSGVVYHCQHLAISIGPRLAPHYPKELPNKSDSLSIIHSADYKSCRTINTQKTVLVIGSGLSALTICKDLLESDSSLTVQLACSKTQAEIIVANSHLLQAGTSNSVIPTLKDLQALGVDIISRYQYHDKKTDRLRFEGGIEKDCTDYGQIICATGYTHYYPRLLDMEGISYNGLGYPEQKTNCESMTVDNLYFPGIPTEASRDTLSITQGSRDAQAVAKVIEERMATRPSDHSIPAPHPC